MLQARAGMVGGTRWWVLQALNHCQALAASYFGTYATYGVLRASPCTPGTTWRPKLQALNAL